MISPYITTEPKVKSVSEPNFELARIWYQQADAKRWSVARIAYHTHGRRNRLKLADVIGRKEDTVDNLSNAYSLFLEMVLEAWQCGKSSEPIRNLRRRFPYTRWSAVYRMWHIYEFELEEAKDWLENFDGGNDAMSAEIENKHGAPEWERRANVVYRQAFKLTTDFGVPDRLQKAAQNYVKEFDFCFPKVKK